MTATVSIHIISTQCNPIYHGTGTLTQSQTGKWLPAKQPGSRGTQLQGWNPRMLHQAGAVLSPGTDSSASISPDPSGIRRGKRRHKKRSKRAARLLAESLDSAAELESSPENYAQSSSAFHSVHNILHPASPEDNSPDAGQCLGSLPQKPRRQSEGGNSEFKGEWAGLQGFLHAAKSGQAGQFAAEALRRISQDSSGVCVS